MLTLQTYKPASLSQLVKSFWCLQVTEDYTEHIIPDGHHEIIFHLSSNHASREQITEPDSFFAGQTLSTYSLELKKGALLYGIRFFPHTLSAVFKFPADRITHQILPLQEIAAARPLQHCISEHPQTTFRNLEMALLKLAAAIDLSDNKYQYIDHAVQQILQYKGHIRIAQLTRSTGISQKYLDTLFTQSVGITPKAICNIIQLNHFINYRTQHPHLNLTKCTYEANFFDQSHLIRLFQKVANRSPKAFFNDMNYINHYFSSL